MAAAQAAPSPDDTLLGYASSLLGVPYLWGGTDPSTGLDCSGFVQNVFARLGVNLPRVSQAQATQGQSVSYRGARAGDLVFYDEPGAGRASHVGIYLGNGLMIDAPHKNATVQIEPIWQGAYFRRVQLPQGAQVGVASSSVPTNKPPADNTFANETAANAGQGGINAPASTTFNLSVLEDQAGYAAAFFKGDKSLEKLVKDAVAHQYTTERFIEALHNTAWYRSKTAAQRSARQLQTGDPTEWAHQLAMEERNIALLATQEGVRLSQQQVNGIATAALTNGYTDDQARQAVVDQFKADTTQGQTLGGVAGADYSNLKATANNYGVPMTEQAYDTWTTKILNGSSTVDDFSNYIKQQAQTIYPGLTDAINRGQTVMDATDSYRQLMGNVLEMPAENVSLQDPLMKKALSYTAPDTTGKSTPGSTPPGVMPQWQFEQMLKSDPRWMQTNNARNQFMSAGLKIGQDLGFSSVSPTSFGGS